MNSFAPLRPFVLAFGLAVLCGPARGEDSAMLPDMSLEDLINTEVVSASRKSQNLQQVAAAVFVITQEDIERSGARSLADVLAMAPGVEVANVGNNRWAVTARGGNGRFANKLQVLKDGRSIYQPLFSAVFWEAEDMVLEDIERIEIIRGPNAAMWGSNTVNGAINIITRKARDTQGGLLAATAGSVDRHNLTARYGMPLGDAGHMRVYAKGVDRRASFNTDGSRATDKGESGMAGFRADWLLSSGNRLSLNGETYRYGNDDTYRFSDPTRPPTYLNPFDSTMTLKGGHVQGRYESLRDDGSELVVQSYFAQHRLDATRAMREDRDTLDLDVQYRFAPAGSHDFMLGFNYRRSDDDVTAPAGSPLSFSVRSRLSRIASIFANDEISIVPDRFHLTLGARLENNSLSGTDLQPTARFLWTPDANHTVWAALSRATRSPSRAESDVTIPLVVQPTVPVPTWLVITNPPGVKLKSEKLDALELGYRQRFGPDLSLDATLFTHRLSDARTPVTGQLVLPPPNPYVLQYQNTSYLGRTRTSGLELALFAQITPTWRLQPSYTWMHTSTRGVAGDSLSTASAESSDKKTPRHQLSLRSQHNLPHSQQLDFWLKYKSHHHLSATTGSVDIPSRANLDIRYAWKPTRSLELSVVGQNLLHRRTLEYLSDELPSVPVETGRGAYVRAEYRF